MTEVERLKQGDVYRHIMAGGGGYGDPLERDPLDVLDDVQEEKVSIAHAAEAYGVVVLPGRPPRLDEAATTALRAKRRDPSNPIGKLARDGLVE
jgi:N-methylhydantoinase B